MSSNTDDRRRGRMDMGRDRMDRGETTGDWRSGPRVEAPNGRGGGGGGGFGREREGGFNREREGGFGRDGPRGEERVFNREGMRDSRDNRDSREGGFGNREGGFGNREGGYGRDSSFRREPTDDKPGAWREERSKDQDRGECVLSFGFVEFWNRNRRKLVGFFDFAIEK